MVYFATALHVVEVRVYDLLLANDVKKYHFVQKYVKSMDGMLFIVSNVFKDQFNLVQRKDQVGNY